MRIDRIAEAVEPSIQVTLDESRREIFATARVSEVRNLFRQSVIEAIDRCVSAVAYTIQEPMEKAAMDFAMSPRAKEIYEEEWRKAVTAYFFKFMETEYRLQLERRAAPPQTQEQP